MENKYDWSKFCRRINVKASMQDLYNAWAVPSAIETWFLRSAAYTKKDGSPADKNAGVEARDEYKWMWHGYSDEIFELGTVLEANGTNRFKFVFGKAGTVTVNIHEEAEAMIVELWQEQIPEDDKGRAQFHVGCSEGWTFYLANLKSIMEGGLDLRNKNEKITRVVNS
jgi:uncharacterized protein YndB with AHSA1/START domain